jgi:hypothetical protein
MVPVLAQMAVLTTTGNISFAAILMSAHWEGHLTWNERLCNPNSLMHQKRPRIMVGGLLGKIPRHSRLRETYATMQHQPCIYSLLYQWI